DGMRVEREGGVPSVERDLLAALDRLHPLLPVGFYSKTFIRPRLAWTVSDRRPPADLAGPPPTRRGPGDRRGGGRSLRRLERIGGGTIGPPVRRGRAR